MVTNPEFLMYCFANSVNSKYKFIERHENGTIELFKERMDKFGDILNTDCLDPMIFIQIPLGKKCSLKQVLSGYKLGTSNRRFHFPSSVHYDYPYNLYKKIFENEWNSEKLSLVLEIPMTNDRWQGLQHALHTLTEREQKAIYYYFQQEDNTLEEAGKMLGVTRERFRQILTKGVRKLRHPTRAIYILKGYKIASGELRKKVFETRQKEIDAANALIDAKIETIKANLNRPSTELLTSRPKDITILDLDLSVRATNCLSRANIKTLEDLSKMTKCDLCKVRNLGRKSLEEIMFKLKEYGIELEEGEMF